MNNSIPLYGRVRLRLHYKPHASRRGIARLAYSLPKIAIFEAVTLPLITNCYQFTNPGGMDGLDDRASPGKWTLALPLTVPEAWGLSQRRTTSDLNYSATQTDI